MTPVGDRPPEGARARPNSEPLEEEVHGELVPEDDLLAALPGLLRIAAGAWWRTA